MSLNETSNLKAVKPCKIICAVLTSQKCPFVRLNVEAFVVVRYLNLSVGHVAVTVNCTITEQLRKEPCTSLYFYALVSCHCFGRFP